MQETHFSILDVYAILVCVNLPFPTIHVSVFYFSLIYFPRFTFSNKPQSHTLFSAILVHNVQFIAIYCPSVYCSTVCLPQFTVRQSTFLSNYFPSIYFSTIYCSAIVMHQSISVNKVPLQSCARHSGLYKLPIDLPFAFPPFRFPQLACPSSTLPTICFLRKRFSNIERFVVFFFTNQRQQSGQQYSSLPSSVFQLSASQRLNTLFSRLFYYCSFTFTSLHSSTLHHTRSRTMFIQNASQYPMSQQSTVLHYAFQKRITQFSLTSYF